jgi:hypothetical protein
MPRYLRIIRAFPYLLAIPGHARGGNRPYFQGMVNR